MTQHAESVGIVDWDYRLSFPHYIAGTLLLTKVHQYNSIRHLSVLLTPFIGFHCLILIHLFYFLQQSFIGVKKKFLSRLVTFVVI